MPTDAQKRANKKYNAKTYKTIAFDCKIQNVEPFKKYCELQGQSKNKILNDFVAKCIKEVEKDETNSTQ